MNTNETKRKNVKPSTKVKTLATLLMAGAAFTACSSDNDINAEQSTKPQVYTMVVKAKGSDAMTRALKLDGTTLNTYWSGNETFDVVQDFDKIGTATAAASETGETTITATLTKLDPDYSIFFHLNGAINDYTGQVGLLTGTSGNSISEKYDYADANLWASNYSVEGNEIITDETIEFSAKQSIVKFTLVDKDNNDAAINATTLNIHCSGDYGVLQTINCITGESAYGDLTITPEGTTNEIYVSMSLFNANDMTLTATDGNAAYSYTKTTSPGFDIGGYYDVTVKMNKVVNKFTADNFMDIIFNGEFKSITADDAAQRAKQCWPIAGGIVYVIYNVSDKAINYVMTEDGETTTTGSISTKEPPAVLFQYGVTAWYVEAPPLPSETIAFYGATGDLASYHTYYGTEFEVSGPIDNTEGGNFIIGQWGDMVIKSEGKTIVKVVFSYTWKNELGYLSFSSGTFDGDATVDNVNATQLTVSSTGTAGTIFSGVTIYYAAE